MDREIFTLAPRTITQLNPLNLNDFVCLVSDNSIRGTVIKANGRMYTIQMIPSMEEINLDNISHSIINKYFFIRIVIIIDNISLYPRTKITSMNILMS